MLFCVLPWLPLENDIIYYQGKVPTSHFGKERTDEASLVTINLAVPYKI